MHLVCNAPPVDVIHVRFQAKALCIHIQTLKKRHSCALEWAKDAVVCRLLSEEIRLAVTESISVHIIEFFSPHQAEKTHKRWSIYCLYIFCTNVTLVVHISEDLGSNLSGFSFALGTSLHITPQDST